jgi:alkylation response protein AidB-like acyl-CoA dehydrogenase
VVLARNEADGQFSCYLVDGKAPGVDNSVVHDTRGLRNFPFGAVGFEDVFIPDDNRIGLPGQGKHVAHTIIARHGRLSLTGLALGIHQRIYDVTASFAKERQRYGESLSNIPDVATRLFDIFSNLEIARSLAYRAAGLERDGGPSARLLALAKKLNSELSCKSAQIAMEVHGGRANLQEFEIGQLLLLDASMTLAPSGSADVLKKRIVDDILGRRAMGWDVP